MIPLPAMIEAWKRVLVLAPTRTTASSAAAARWPVSSSRVSRSLPRVLDRDPVARVRARHARAKCARRRASSIPGRSSPSTTSTSARSGTAAGHPRAARRALGGAEARRRLPAVTPRRPPGSPDDRAGRPAGVQAHDRARLRDSVEQLRVLVRRLLRARAAARRAQGRGACEVRLAAAPATPIRSTSGTSPASTEST